MEIWEDEEHLSKGLNKILSGTFFMKKACSYDYRIRYEINVEKILVAHKWYLTLDFYIHGKSGNV